LAALRQKHGIAAAAIVLARTYPFNPSFDLGVLSAQGPPGSVTNPVEFKLGLSFRLELCRQGVYRREAAAAALSRTDWEIAQQETALAVRVARAFRAVLYRNDKVALLEETVRLDQQVADLVRTLRAQGKLRGADLRARQAAVAEADARLQLTIKDRFGNPAIGPYYQKNETSVNFIGLTASVPLPVFNTHRGEIQQQQALRQLAMLELRQFEVQV